MIVEKDIKYRKIMAETIEKTDFGQVAKVSSSGSIALDWLAQRKFDVVLLDTEIIKTEGMDLLKAMVRYEEVYVVIAGKNNPEEAKIALEGLKTGALDVFIKPHLIDGTTGLNAMKGYLQSLFAQIKIKSYSGHVKQIKITDPAEKSGELKTEKASPVGRKKIPGKIDLLVIASSTGGPQALERVLGSISSDINIPVLIVQHMPLDFTRILARSLDKKCRLVVREAETGEELEAGKVLIAPGDNHMLLERTEDSKLRVKLNKSNPVNGVRPSADKLFESMLYICDKVKILAVILTGMGNDGMRGLMEIKKHGDCYCITQSERTCVVYGMPKSVYDAGLSDEVSDIDKIAGRINQILGYGGSGE